MVARVRPTCIIPRPPELLILADSGGSNGAAGASVEVRPPAARGRSASDCPSPSATIPTGASKWNPIEHRLFSEISKHWAGHPLDSYPTILHLIEETTTQTGLRVESFLVTKHYATGQKVSDQQMRELRLRNHSILPEWNYTLLPHQNRN